MAMKKLILRTIQVLAVLCLVLNAQLTLNAQIDVAKNSVYVRYEPVNGGPQKIRAKDPDGKRVRIDNQYTLAENSIINRLKRNGSVAFWYDIFPSDTAGHFLVKARTKRNSLGFTGTYYFYGKTPKQQAGWIQDAFAKDFADVSCRMTDFSVGLYLAHQLCVKNRHRLSLELALGYRQTKQLFDVGRYTTEYDAVDPDGTSYLRQVEVSDYNESLLWRSVSLPIGLRYDWFFLKCFSVFVGGGLQNDFVVQQVSNATGNVFCSGLYGEEYFNVLIDQNGYYDFGRFPNTTFKPVEADKTLYSMYGYGTVGLQVFFGKTISLEVAGIYHRMIYSDVMRPAGTDYRLVTSADSYQSMQSCVSPFALHRWGVNAKLKFNF